MQKYAELKTKFNKIDVNVNKSCPSRDIDPVECDSDHPFRQQAIVFHPDKNPRCRAEAESKFKQLHTLRGCRQESPVQNVRLIGNGKRKSKQSGKTMRSYKTRRVK